MKLLHLYRRGVGGERVNAGRLLSAHLAAYDLTLYDLDPSLPVTQDLSAIDRWRESAALVARLGTPEQDDVLTRLVDATDLTDAEVQRVLNVLDLHRLAEVRADGWAHGTDVPPDELRRAASEITPRDLVHGPGSIAERFVRAALRRHWERAHPVRLLRAPGPLEREIVRGLIEGLTDREAHITADGVEAHLNADELARARALIAQHLPALVPEALRRAREVARTFAVARR
ncbi:hypothetical protein DES52_11914 [Deinococcus yavapaiensis KR-236]|uniref:Uncharacterized protein n=2 Tax=Deinococcus TaxID=1298 RepID=A0A318S015_9DEIO|nr:hypothetical protein DES52_11914 [Deinococcus yavapaiensis KR-236]